MTELQARRTMLAALLAGILATMAAAGSQAAPDHGERGSRGHDDRERIERREEGFRKLPREEQQRLREAENRYRNMPPEQREELRQRWRSMSENERDRYRRRVERNGN